MGDWTAVQADEAELSFEMFLRWECNRNQDTDMGDIDSQPPIDGHAERADQKMEFLRSGDNGQNYANVLCGLLQPFQ